MISAGSLVRAQSGPLNKVKVRRVKVKKRLRPTSKIVITNFVFGWLAINQAPKTNCERKEVSERLALANNRPPQVFFENYR